MATKIVIVDDHKLLRDGLKAILKLEADFQVIGECETGAEAVALVRKLKPEIVLMDLSLPGLNGIEATTEILRHAPGTHVLVLSMHDDEYSVVTAIRSGARGFVLKKASDSDLIDAVRAVAKGGSYLSSKISDRFLKRVQRGDLEVKMTSPVEELSSRERQVLRLVAEGNSSKEIANMLNLGLQTVRSYRKTMMKKLQVTNVAGLTQMALAAGLTRFDQRAAAGSDPGIETQSHPISEGT